MSYSVQYSRLFFRLKKNAPLVLFLALEKAITTIWPAFQVQHRMQQCFGLNAMIEYHSSVCFSLFHACVQTYQINWTLVLTMPRSGPWCENTLVEPVQSFGLNLSSDPGYSCGDTAFCLPCIIILRPVVRGTASAI